MQRIAGISIALNIEFAGELVRVGKNKYVYTEPKAGTANESDVDTSIPGYVGFYHSHAAFDPSLVSGGVDYNETFSSCSAPDQCDRSIADDSRKPAYVVTPSKKMKRYDPDKKKQQNGKVTEVGKAQ